MVLCSSGTTGTPKIIPLQAEAMLRVAAGVVAHHELGPSERGYSPLPLFHINGLVVGVLATVLADASIVLERRFSAKRFWATIERYEVTWLNLVPAIIAILADAEMGNADVRARVRFARSASCPLSAATQQQFEQRCGIGVLETFGMTEGASQLTANPLRTEARKAGSVGLPVGVELRVVWGEGEPAPVGVVGAVEVRGPSITTTYWSPAGASPATRPAVAGDGWLRTGDLGKIDEDGYLWLAGRVDDVINRGGEKLYPREIEEVLCGHGLVLDAVVVGRPHRALGQEPVAFVLPREGCFDHEGLVVELNERCRTHLSRYKRPAAITVAASLPAGPTGKVRRAAVRELVLAAEPGL